MNARSWILAAVVLLLVSASAIAGDGTELVYKLAKGSTLKVDQTLEIKTDMKSAGGVTGGSGVVAGSSKLKGAVTIQETFTDEGVEEKDGRLGKVRRAYENAKVKTGGKSMPHPLEGSVLLLDGTGDSTQVTVEQGKPGEEVIGLLQNGPVDPVQLLLPGKPVKAGDTWQIETAGLRKLHALLGIGLTGLPGEAGEDLADRMKDMADMQQDAQAETTFSARVKSISAAEAVIEYVGKGSEGNSAKVKVGGIEVSGSPGATCEIRATLRFNAKDGRPESLEWAEKDVMASAGGVNVPGMGVTGGGSTSSEEWTLKRTYHAGK